MRVLPYKPKEWIWKKSNILVKIIGTDYLREWGPLWKIGFSLMSLNILIQIMFIKISA